MSRPTKQSREASRRARARARRRKRLERKSSGQGSILKALTSSALALPGLAHQAAAESAPLEVRTDYRFSRYTEDSLPSSKVIAGGETSRYEIDIHQFRFAAPIGDRFDVGLEVAHETMSGATPWYVTPGQNGAEPVQVMTGATIEEARTDALVSGNYYLESGKASLSGGFSTENDYLAINAGLGGERNFNEKNTTVSGGLGFSYDQIEPVDVDQFPTRPKNEDKQNYSVFASIAQVVGRSSSIQSTLKYERNQGYLSDPYKLAFVENSPVSDERPDARNRFSWLTRYRHHFSGLDGTVHFDYRLYLDDWSVNSHTLELAWHQSLFDSIRLIPSLRYYSQSQADFYAPFYVDARSDGLRSSDYRLSPYGAYSWKVKAETRFQTWSLIWDANISWERYVSEGDLALGSVKVENPGLVSYNMFSIGLTARF